MVDRWAGPYSPCVGHLYNTGSPESSPQESIFSRHMCYCQAQDKPMAGFQLISPLSLSLLKTLNSSFLASLVSKGGPSCQSPLYSNLSVGSPSALDLGRNCCRRLPQSKPTSCLAQLALTSDLEIQGRPDLWDSQPGRKGDSAAWGLKENSGRSYCVAAGGRSEIPDSLSIHQEKLAYNKQPPTAMTCSHVCLRSYIQNLH